MLLGLGVRKHDLTSASHVDRFADAHGHGGVTYAGLTLHKPARWHVLWGTGMSALMWCALHFAYVVMHFNRSCAKPFMWPLRLMVLSGLLLSAAHECTYS